MDAPSITYELVKVLSETQLNKDILSVMRLMVGEVRVIVQGASLSESQKDEIADKVRAAYPASEDTYRLYKLIFPPQPPGIVVRYTGMEREEGSFTVTTEEFGGKDTPVYYLQLEEQTYTYYWYELLNGGRASVESIQSFTEDLTEEFRQDYPGVEAVWRQQRLVEGY
ncbi:MAG: hypothetical protein LUE93_10710 [Bacteroides sp.]|nr:hypothetical protein [Bacteroides sp.]